MRLFDYRQSSEADKNQWLNTFKITTGLKYFGGKSQIGKDLMHRICNMAERMDMNGKRANIFIDGFTGGGKIGLSIPEGWFDTIVMNDLNYGIVSYYNCCKECPEALYKMIKLLGTVMDKQFYNLCAFHRSNNGVTSEKQFADELISLVVKINGKEKPEDIDDDGKFLTDEEMNEELMGIKELIENKTKKQRKRFKIALSNMEYLYDERVDELVSGAMTYWVTKLEFIGQTDPYEVTYNAAAKDNLSFNATRTNEKETIEKAIVSAKDQVKYIHDKMIHNNIIIENLDYRELIKKYNGKEYLDIYGTTVDEYLKSIQNAYWELQKIKDDETCKAIYDSKEKIVLILGEYIHTELAESIYNDFLDNFEQYGDTVLGELYSSLNKIIGHYEEMISDKNVLMRYYRVFMKDHLHQDETLAKQNKLWYFDPPYHPATLYAGMEAPYEDKFSWGMANEMVKILHNDNIDNYGELEYFIKSDYCPKKQYEIYNRQLDDARARLKERLISSKSTLSDPDIIELMDKLEKKDANGRYTYDPSEEEIDNLKSKMGTKNKKQVISILTYIVRMNQQISYVKAAYHDFDALEENTERTDEEGNVIPANKINPVYYKLKLGEYDKGIKEDSVGSTKGVEYIWCRGNYLPEDDN